jgi:hypothetical protein
MRSVYVALMFSLILLVSGCVEYLPSFGGTNETEVVAFVGGDNGLIVSFVGNNPPARVFQNHNFNVVLQLENKGENNIEEGDIRVVISNMQNFGLEDNIIKYNENRIQKRVKAEEGFIPGGIDYIAFNDVAYSGPAMITEDSPVSIAVDVCYPYKTTAVADVCVTRERSETICDPFGKPDVQTSSSPILVTEITQMSNGLIKTDSDAALLELRIDFERVGEGEIYNSDSTCSELNIDNIDIITIDQITLGADTYNGDEVADICGYSDNKFGLDSDGKGFIICSLTVPNVAYDFEDRFTITTSYMHTQLLTQQISVMPVLESMNTCTNSEECKIDQYCEQPGFCRSKIQSPQSCGLPMELLQGSNSDVSCASNNCNYGSCIGDSLIPGEEIPRTEQALTCNGISKWTFDGGIGSVEDYGWEVLAEPDNRCSGEEGWIVTNEGYNSDNSFYTTANLSDVKYCIRPEKLYTVPEGANVTVSFAAKFDLDGGDEDNFNVWCVDRTETSSNYQIIAEIPGDAAIEDITLKHSDAWPDNEDGWVKFEKEVPNACLVNNNFDMLFMANIDASNQYGPIYVDQLEVKVDC